MFLYVEEVHKKLPDGTFISLAKYTMESHFHCVLFFLHFLLHNRNMILLCILSIESCFCENGIFGIISF